MLLFSIDTLYQNYAVLEYALRCFLLLAGGSEFLYRYWYMQLTVRSTRCTSMMERLFTVQLTEVGQIASLTPHSNRVLNSPSNKDR